MQALQRHWMLHLQPQRPRACFMMLHLWNAMKYDSFFVLFVEQHETVWSYFLQQTKPNLWTRCSQNSKLGEAPVGSRRRVGKDKLERSQSGLRRRIGRSWRRRSNRRPGSDGTTQCGDRVTRQTHATHLALTVRNGRPKKSM